MQTQTTSTQATSMISSSVNRAVVGLGATGLSTMRHLRSKGHVFVAYDQTCPTAESQLWQDIEGLVDRKNIGFAENGLEILVNADVIYLSPGIAPDAPWLLKQCKQDVKISGDLDLFAQSVNAPVIAITGSNAKSTVTTLVGEMAKACGVKVAVGGNLGTPMLDLLNDEVELYVLELSSFQLERSDGLRGHIACILNVSSDHLDRHGSMPVYHAQKQKVYKGAVEAIFNRDDLLTQPLSREGLGERSFALSKPLRGQFGIDVVEGEKGQQRLAKYGEELLFEADKVKLLGEHNLANALAGFAIGQAAGFSIEKMREALYRFSGLPHRMEYVAEIEGVRFVNDSKATNVGASQASIKGVSGSLDDGQKVVLIAGGIAKGADLQPLVDSCSEYSVDMQIIGESAPQILSLTETKPNVNAEIALSLEQAVEQAYQRSSAGDVVLLAPACASFDMFDSYQHRGDCFKQVVENIQARASNE